MVIIASQTIDEFLTNHSSNGINKNYRNFYFRKEENVFIDCTLQKYNTQNCIEGIIVLIENTFEIDSIVTKYLNNYKLVICILQNANNLTKHKEHSISCFFANNKNTVKSDFQIVELKNTLFSRIKGLYETDVLFDKTALLIGLGSGGSLEAIELAKSGVGNFILVDFDRLEVENLVRHACGINDIGRFKTKAVKDLILSKNPNANIITYEERCTFDWLPQLRKLVAQSDIVYCSTDNRESRTIVNIACIENQKQCIFGGAFRRAYGGQVLNVVPGKTPCYQCFIDSLPIIEEDKEISSIEDSDRISYSDIKVPIEPGLSLDIMPISNLTSKLGVLALLKDKQTTLKSLYEDLSAPLFLWLNRREINTQYEKLPPLPICKDDVRIMKWYEIDLKKNVSCPVCGNFHNSYSSKSISKSEINNYGA